MARRKSIGEYILSFLSGGIRGASQVSQMKAAMNSKAALEAQKAKQKERENYRGVLQKTVEDTNRPYSERMGAWDEYMQRNPGMPLPQPERVIEEIKVSKGPSELEKARTGLIKKQTEQVGKPKPKSGSPIDRKTQELNALSDDFKALEQWKQTGDDDILSGYFGERVEGKDSAQLDAIMRKRVEDFDTKWKDNMASLIYQSAPEAPSSPQVGPPTDFLVGGEDEERQNAINLIREDRGEDFEPSEEDIVFVIENYIRK